MHHARAQPDALNAARPGALDLAVSQSGTGHSRVGPDAQPTVDPARTAGHAAGAALASAITGTRAIEPRIRPRAKRAPARIRAGQRATVAAGDGTGTASVATHRGVGPGAHLTTAVGAAIDTAAVATCERARAAGGIAPGCRVGTGVHLTGAEGGAFDGAPVAASAGAIAAFRAGDPRIVAGEQRAPASPFAARRAAVSAGGGASAVCLAEQTTPAVACHRAVAHPSAGTVRSGAGAASIARRRGLGRRGDAKE